MPSIVFVARHNPFPLISGTPIRTHRLLTGLAQSFETTFVTFDHDPRSGDRPAPRDELEELLTGIDVETVRGLHRPKRIDQLLSLVRRRSFAAGRYASKELRGKVESVAARGERVLVHFEELGAALCGPISGAVNVYSAHNVEVRLAADVASQGTHMRRAFASLEQRKLAAEERRILKSMDLCIAVSEVDADFMRRAGARRVVVCPNGADRVAPLPYPTRGSDDPVRLLFVGADYAPNHDALRWFTDRVLPSVRKTGIRVELDVVGFSPRRRNAVEGVAIHGVVPSVEPYYRRAHAVIVPIRSGSGTRLKVLEAMAWGRPVISTTVGVEGLDISPNHDYLAADDADTFAGAVGVVADYPDRSRAIEPMLENARRTVERFFWPRIVEQLTAVYRAELDGRNAAARGMPESGDQPPVATGGE